MPDFLVSFWSYDRMLPKLLMIWFQNYHPHADSPLWLTVGMLQRPSPQVISLFSHPAGSWLCFPFAGSPQPLGLLPILPGRMATSIPVIDHGLEWFRGYIREAELCPWTLWAHPRRGHHFQTFCFENGAHFHKEATWQKKLPVVNNGFA